MNNSLGGFEFLSCIPGSIGGAVIMNSGCYNNDISKILLSICAIDYCSQKKTRFITSERQYVSFFIIIYT